MQAVGADTDDMDQSSPEEVLLDENAEAQKHRFYMLPDQPFTHSAGIHLRLWNLIIWPFS